MPVTCGSYPGSGYVVHFLNSTEMSLIVPELQRVRWVDFKTRAVFADFAFFNPHLNMFIVARVLTEFLPSGRIYAVSNFRSLILQQFGSCLALLYANRHQVFA